MGATASTTVIAASTRLGAVALTVRDLDRATQFYSEAIGLEPRVLGDGSVSFRAGEVALVELVGDASATALDRRATGLFHLAILVPSRRALAEALLRLARAGWTLDGASDHLVSEALYLSDPDGNGIEIYRDRPRDDWPRDDGRVRMATLALDLDDLLAELGDERTPPPRVADGTGIGHVHLQVSELDRTEAFWSGAVGFEVMVRAYPGALFVAAGGYHHHLGLNTWHSAGHGPPARGAVGLRHFEIVLPDRGELGDVVTRIRASGAYAEQTPDGAWLVRDPSGNAALLRTG